MKTNIKSKGIFIAVAALILTVASCGNSRKNGQAAQTGTPQDSAVVVEEEVVTIEIDSIAPDSVVPPKK